MDAHERAMGSRRNPAINQSSAIRRLPAIEYEYENKIEDENNEVEQEKVEAFVADHAEQLRVRTWVARENGSASRFRQAFPSTFSKKSQVVWHTRLRVPRLPIL